MGLAETSFLTREDWGASLLEDRSWFALQTYADWLCEGGREDQAASVRLLAANRKLPLTTRSGTSPEAVCWCYGYRRGRLHDLPTDVFNRLPGTRWKKRTHKVRTIRRVQHVGYTQGTAIYHANLAGSLAAAYLLAIDEGAHAFARAAEPPKPKPRGGGISTFTGGPAAGVALSLRRAPLLLRVVRADDGEWDALDQLDDEPRPSEQVFVYRRRGLTGHIRMAGGGGPLAEYDWLPEQPTGDQVQTTEAWRAWCQAQPKEPQHA